MKWFKKKTREEEMAFRVSAVLNELTNVNDFEFTDHETAQIKNEVDRLYLEYLYSKREDFINKSIQAQQKADELKHVIDLIKNK